MGEAVVSSDEVMEVELQEEEKRVREMEGKEEKEKSSSGVVRWGRFLPRMVLRVLLVEPDDSTRQIIAALLRKCSYKGNFLCARWCLSHFLRFFLYFCLNFVFAVFLL